MNTHEIIDDEIRGQLYRFPNITQIELTPDMNLVSEFGADSLDIMEIVMDTEALVGVHIDNRKISDMQTVGDLYKIFDDALANEKNN